MSEAPWNKIILHKTPKFYFKKKYKKNFNLKVLFCIIINFVKLIPFLSIFFFVKFVQYNWYLWCRDTWFIHYNLYVFMIYKLLLEDVDYYCIDYCQLLCIKDCVEKLVEQSRVTSNNAQTIAQHNNHSWDHKAIAPFIDQPKKAYANL